jgi:hypothetical protein
MGEPNEIARRGAWLFAIMAVVLFVWPSGSRAQSSSEPEKKEDAGPSKTVKSYETKNGTQTYSRIEERERTKTADGDIVTERVRMPAYEGDDRVLLEREIHTKKLPDGTIERETILKNPDGNGGMQPIEITRETIHPGEKSSTIEREVSKPGIEGGWRTVRRETVQETHDKTSSESTREVAEPTVNGDWKPVVRELHWDKKTDQGETQGSLTQAPDSTGALSTYQAESGRTLKSPNGETREVTITRRDFGATESAAPVVVEHTVTREKTLPDGNVVTHSTTESDLVNGGAARNLESSHPEIVEEKTTVESPGKNGTATTATTVSRRGSAAPDLHSSHRVVVEKDSSGHVRQIYIPSQ